MAAHGDDFDLVLSSRRDQDVSVRVRWDSIHELEQLLEDAGLPLPPQFRLESIPMFETVIATVRTPEMWTALGASITAFLARNKFRRVRIGKNEITLTGYGPEDVERILRAVGELREQVEHNEHERIKGF